LIVEQKLCSGVVSRESQIDGAAEKQKFWRHFGSFWQFFSGNLNVSQGIYVV
jgi:hypothetical protein